jgi:hypothetical protein
MSQTPLHSAQPVCPTLIAALTGKCLNRVFEAIMCSDAVKVSIPPCCDSSHKPKDVVVDNRIGNR